MTNDEPLIYTIKGNLPIASLDYKTLAEKKDGNVILVEEWRHGGEVVKRAVHVIALDGLETGAEQAQMG
jgi:hypothetical protein